MQQLVIWYNLFLSKLNYIDWLGPSLCGFIWRRFLLVWACINLPTGTIWWPGLAAPIGGWVCQLPR